MVEVGDVLEFKFSVAVEINGFDVNISVGAEIVIEFEVGVGVAVDECEDDGRKEGRRRSRAWLRESIVKD